MSCPKCGCKVHYVAPEAPFNSMVEALVLQLAFNGDRHAMDRHVAVADQQRIVARAVIAAHGVTVPVGDNAVMTMPNPWGDPHIEWSMRYSRDLNDSSGSHGGAGRFVAAEIIASFDYLVSEAITMKEATRRLRLMRQSRAAALKAGASSTDTRGVEGSKP